DPAGSADCLADPQPRGCAGSLLPRLCFDPHRKREIEGRSLARLGLYPDSPTVHLDNALSDRQAEPGAALLAGDRAVRLLELLEDLGLIARGYTGSGVADRNGECPVRR